MKRKIRFIVGFIAVAILMCSCGKGSSILNYYSPEADPAVNTISDSPITYAKGFASGIGVVSADAPNSEGSDKVNSEAAILASCA